MHGDFNEPDELVKSKMILFANERRLVDNSTSVLIKNDSVYLNNMRIRVWLLRGIWLVIRRNCNIRMKAMNRA